MSNYLGEINNWNGSFTSHSALFIARPYHEITTHCVLIIKMHIMWAVSNMVYRIV